MQNITKTIWKFLLPTLYPSPTLQLDIIPPTRKKKNSPICKYVYLLIPHTLFRKQFQLSPTHTVKERHKNSPLFVFWNICVWHCGLAALAAFGCFRVKECQECAIKKKKTLLYIPKEKEQKNTHVKWMICIYTLCLYIKNCIIRVFLEYNAKNNIETYSEIFILFSNWLSLKSLKSQDY